MSKPILIVGGGPAGLAAATALSSVGQKAIVVEKEQRLGGAPILSGYAKLVPTGEWAKDAIGGMVSRVETDASIQRYAGRTVAEFTGEPGAFRAKLSDGTTLDVGAAILCTGFTHFDSVNKPEWGFGTYPDVVTTTQVEQMISSGKGVRCPSDGRKPERVAILLCVGSRDRQIGREWCSKICCTVSCQHRDGNPRGAAGLPRLHLLHGHPHLRALRDQLLLDAARRNSRSSTSRRGSPRSRRTARS